MIARAFVRSPRDHSYRAAQTCARARASLRYLARTLARLLTRSPACSLAHLHTCSHSRRPHHPDHSSIRSRARLAFAFTRTFAYSTCSLDSLARPLTRFAIWSLIGTRGKRHPLDICHVPLTFSAKRTMGDFTHPLAISAHVSLGDGTDVMVFWLQLSTILLYIPRHVFTLFPP
jgi:hypothetical protein